jgi:thymidylate kinase
MQRPIYVIFEGVDGSGKTSIIKDIAGSVKGEVFVTKTPAELLLEVKHAIEERARYGVFGQ